MKNTKTKKQITEQTLHACMMWLLFNLSSEGGQVCHLWYNDFCRRNDQYLMATRAKYELS